MIEVWDVLPGAADQSVLSPDERERAARFRFERDRDRFIAARAALRRILSGYTQTDPAGIRFRYNRFGKPEPDRATAFRFNASHSEGRLLVAVGEREVGVDVERVRPGYRFDEIARRYFPDERATTLEEFFRAWTRREAYVKALGCGLSGMREPMRDGWWVEELEAGPGWAAAVAAQGDRCRIVRRVLET